MSEQKRVRFLIKTPGWSNFVYRPENVTNPNIPQAQNATLGVKFAQNRVILDDYWLIGGTRLSRTRFRLKHPLIYLKRGIRNLYYKIKRIFVKPKMIQPMIRHPQALTKPRGVCHGCYQEQEEAAQRDKNDSREPH